MSSINKKLKKAGSITGRILTVAIAALAVWLIICSVSGNIPMLFGYGIVHIETGSMEPTIKTGTLILIEKTEAAEIQAGDIITFKSDDPKIKGLPNTHRVNEVVKNDNGSIEFITKGDANYIPDEQTAKGENLYGKYVTTLTVLTAVYRFIAKPYVFWPLVLIFLGIFIFSYINDLKGPDNKDRKKEETDRLMAEELEKLKNSKNDPENNKDNNNENDTKGGDDTHV
jgi:signal peptidase